MPNIRCVATLDLNNSLAISWQRNLYNYIDITRMSGGTKLIVSLYVQKLWRVRPHVTPETRSLYCGVRAVMKLVNTRKYVETKRLSSNTWRKNSGLWITLFKMLPEDFQQLSRRLNMQVSAISYSWALDSGLVAAFRGHPVAVYLKCKLALFCDIAWPNACFCFCCAVTCYT